MRARGVRDPPGQAGPAEIPDGTEPALTADPTEKQP